MSLTVDQVCITVENGGLSFVDDAPLASLHALGVCRRRRLSHIEPNGFVLRLLFHAVRMIGIVEWTRRWSCRWRVNMSPVDGPIIPMSRRSSRADALAVERNWLWQHRSI
jgi:hypothetical protein